MVLLQTVTSDWHKCTVHIPPVLPLSFLHSPALNILLWKNPLRRYRPLPLHMLKISTQDHLYPPPTLSGFSFCLLDCCPCHLFTSLQSTRVQFISWHNPSDRLLFNPAWHFCWHRKRAIPPSRQPDQQMSSQDTQTQKKQRWIFLE